MMALLGPSDTRANGTLMARGRLRGFYRPGTRDQREALTWGFTLERVTRIELALSAWEADVLPLNYTRKRPAVRGADMAPADMAPADMTCPDMVPDALGCRGSACRPPAAEGEARQ